MENSTKTKIIPLIFSGGLFLVFILFIIKNIDEYGRLFSFSLGNLLLLILVTAAVIFLNGLINYILLHGLRIEIDLLSSIGLAVINTAANLLPFAGGFVAKGLYLKKKYDLEYTRYTSSTGALYIVFLATNGLMGLIGLFLIKVTQKLQIPLIMIIGFGLMAASLLLLWIPLKFKFIPDKWKNQIDTFNAGWQVFQNNKYFLIKLIIVQIVSVLAMSLRFWIGFRFLSLQISFLDGLLFASATILTRLVSFAPGGLGIREGIIAIVGNFIGYDPMVSALAVGLDRVVSTTLILVLGLYFIYNLSLDVLE